ncbi:MAG: hypothetical protein M0R77_19465 [Gammaproteobacteria bacterium]|nr:hypothetical protein [Gammaproteobacteria bacterium]
MQKVNILTNFYPAVLWDVPVFGNKKEVKSGLYKKRVESDEKFTQIKSDLIESGLSSASVFEVGVLKYLPPFLFLALIFSVNLYYPSMLGLMSASLAYIAYYVIKDKVSDFFANLFLFALFVFFIVLYASNYLLFSKLHINGVASYSIQYFVMFYILERVLVDIYLLGFKGWKKVDKANLSYVKIVDDNLEAKEKRGREVFRRWFFGFLGVVALLSFILGGAEFYNKVMIVTTIEKKLEKDEKTESEVLRLKSSKILEERLINQSKILKFKIPNSDIELLREDFDKYVATRPIAYEKVVINSTIQMVRARDGSPFKLDFSTKKFIAPVCFVKKYKDGKFRWHFMYSKQEVVIMNTEAR